MEDVPHRTQAVLIGLGLIIDDGYGKIELCGSVFPLFKTVVEFLIGDHIDLTHGEFCHFLHDVVHDGLSTHLDQRFWCVLCEGIEPGSIASCKDKDLHQRHLI